MNELAVKTHKHVVTVDFVIKPEMLEAFMVLVRDNARTSIAVEPECFRFDIATPADRSSNHVFLYEIYQSKAAFEHHLQCQHYTDFDRATAPMIISKTPRQYDLEEFAKVDL